MAEQTILEVLLLITQINDKVERIDRLRWIGTQSLLETMVENQITILSLLQNQTKEEVREKTNEIFKKKKANNEQCP